MIKFNLNWPTPVVKDNKLFDNHSEILSAAIEYSGQTNDDQALQKTKGKLYHDPRIISLKTWMFDLVGEFVSNLNQNFWEKQSATIMDDIWSWSSKNYHNSLHNHPNCSWSIIYCVEPGESNQETGNGKTILYSPLPWGHHVDPGLAYMERTFLEWHVLNKGDYILFPSYIKHEAMYGGNTPRTVIAANFSFR